MVQAERAPQKGLFDYLSRVDELLVIVIRLLLAQEGQGLLPGGIQQSISERYELPVVQIKRLATSSLTYVELVSWTIPTTKFGVLSFVEMDSDTFPSTRFKLEGGGRVLFEDLQLSSAVSLELPSIKLAPGSEIKLAVLSSTGSEIVAYGDIVGKEVVIQ